MDAYQQKLEQYLQARPGSAPGLAVTRLDKLADGWESDNYLVTVESGQPAVRADQVWRIYSGAGSQAKARHEFNSMQKLHAAGYPVPRVFLVETENSPVERPFVLMEYIPGETMLNLLAKNPTDARLLDQFCQLFVQLHALDWQAFEANLPGNDPFLFVDRLLAEGRGLLLNYPELGVAPFFDWVLARRSLFACARPAPAHQDFHPGNVLICADGSARVIDWTSFDVTDARFDLAWTLVLLHAHARPGLRDQVFEGYQRHAGQAVEQIAVFEAVACARRLFDLTVSLTQGAQRLGMNAQAAAAMRASMPAHRRVHRLFVERTGLHIPTFDTLFGGDD